MILFKNLIDHLCYPCLFSGVKVSLGVKSCDRPREASAYGICSQCLVLRRIICAAHLVGAFPVPFIALSVKLICLGDDAAYDHVVAHERQVFLCIKLVQSVEIDRPSDYVVIGLRKPVSVLKLLDHRQCLFGSQQFFSGVMIVALFVIIWLGFVFSCRNSLRKHFFELKAVTDLFLCLFLAVAELPEHFHGKI